MHRALALCWLWLLAGCEPGTGGADGPLDAAREDRDGGCSGADCTCKGPCPAGQGCCGGACTSLVTPQNCGACGSACPGLDQPGGLPGCTDPGEGPRCDFACRGDHYDVDGDPKNGCERGYVTPPARTQEAAPSRGRKGCGDTESRDSFAGMILSDGRAHRDPAVEGFHPLIGAAPEFVRVEADGGLGCVDDYDVSFETSGGGSLLCYQLTIRTNKKTETVLVNGSGAGRMTAGSGSYGDGSIIYFKIEKVCTLPTREAVTYKVSYHL